MRFHVLPPALTDVEIARSAAVWELKVAIEELFFTLFDDTDKTISWYGLLPMLYLGTSHDVIQLLMPMNNWIATLPPRNGALRLWIQIS